MHFIVSLFMEVVIPIVGVGLSVSSNQGNRQSASFVDEPFIHLIVIQSLSI